MEDGFLTGPIGPDSYKNLSLTMNYFTGDYHDTENAVDRTTDVERTRSDFDINFDYKLIGQFIIGIGYKLMSTFGEINRSISNDTTNVLSDRDWHRNYEGLVQGASLHQYLLKRLFISGMFSYSWLQYKSHGKNIRQDFIFIDRGV